MSIGKEEKEDLLKVLGEFFREEIGNRLTRNNFTGLITTVNSLFESWEKETKSEEEAADG